MATKVEGLRCICGNASIYSEPIIVRDLVVNQLYCPECGIIMRSPSADKGGQWLRKHWKDVHMKVIEFERCEKPEGWCVNGNGV